VHQQKYQYSPSLEDLNATVDAFAALATHFKAHSNIGMYYCSSFLFSLPFSSSISYFSYFPTDIAEIYYKRQGMFLSTVGCHTESANVLLLVAETYVI
jgi:hypothetical protein